MKCDYAELGRPNMAPSDTNTMVKLMCRTPQSRLRGENVKRQTGNPWGINDVWIDQWTYGSYTDMQKESSLVRSTNFYRDFIVRILDLLTKLNLDCRNCLYLNYIWLWIVVIVIV